MCLSAYVPSNAREFKIVYLFQGSVSKYQYKFSRFIKYLAQVCIERAFEELEHVNIFIFWHGKIFILPTGKSFSEELILASTNPQYYKRLFIELRVQYMKITSSEHVVYLNYFEVHNMFWVGLNWTGHMSFLTGQDWTGPQICQTGPAGWDWIQTYFFKHFT